MVDEAPRARRSRDDRAGWPIRERWRAIERRSPPPRAPAAESSPCASAPAAGRTGRIKVYEALRAEVEARGVAREVEARATGCQGFCQGGPLLLLVPEGIVYQHVRVEDVAEIVEKTLLGGEVVERLLYVDPATDLQCAREEEIPFYRAPAARAAARQRPPRPDLHRRLHRARRLLGPGPRPGDGARGGPRGGQALRPARARRRRLPDGPQVGGVPQGGGRPQVRGLQRRRGRPRRLHGRRAARGQPAQRARGHDHRRLRDGRARGPRLRAPGVPGGRRAHHARHRAGARARPAGRRRSSAASCASTCGSAAAAARSSAARRAP